MTVIAFYSLAVVQDELLPLTIYERFVADLNDIMITCTSSVMNINCIALKSATMY